ncbi:MAG: TRAP transporter small permease [Deltaproteobacteria bacterium]|nr:TRAP transporter small permease [Deltaproteobacteria bacterium]MBW2341411.1 TRAP transporter small permease [Deltaproteobacteria bacterium]
MKKILWMEWLFQKTQKVSMFLGYFSGVLVLLMVACIIYDVVMRHIFNDPTIWADEFSCYLLVAITFLGAAYTLVIDGHIRVETIVERLPHKVREWVEFIADILGFGFLIIFGCFAFGLAWSSYIDVNLASTLVRTPLFIPQLSVALGLTWLCLQMLGVILQRSVRIWKKE